MNVQSRMGLYSKACEGSLVAELLIVGQHQSAYGCSDVQKYLQMQLFACPGLYSDLFPMAW